MILMRVDFPAPFSPSSAWISLAFNSKSTSWRATAPGNVLTMLRMLTSGDECAILGLRTSPGTTRGSGLEHDAATGHVERGSGDVGCGVRREEQHRPDLIANLRNPPQGRQFLNPRHLVCLMKGGDPRGSCGARSHCVDGDAKWSEFPCQVARQAKDACLRRGVVRGAQHHRHPPCL